MSCSRGSVVGALSDGNDVVVVEDVLGVGCKNSETIGAWLAKCVNYTFNISI